MANKTIPELQETETPDVSTTFIPVDDGIQTKKLKLVNLLRRPRMYKPDITVSGGTLNVFQTLISIENYKDDMNTDWWIADVNIQFTFSPTWSGSHSTITIAIDGIEFDSIQGQPGGGLVRHATGTDEAIVIAQPGNEIVVQHSSVSSIFGYSIQGQFNLFDKPEWYEEDGLRMRTTSFVGGGSVDSVNNVGPDEFGNVELTTDDVLEGPTNKYFTAALAKTATVANAIVDGVADVAPSQNAVFDALATRDSAIAAKAATTYVDSKVEDNITNGVTDKAPSQNVVYDQIQSLLSTIGSKVVDSINDGVTDSAPSQNAVYDALAMISTAVSGKADAAATSTALGLRQLLSEKGNANGYAPLDTNARVPLVHLPSLKQFTFFGNADFEDTANGALPAGWSLYNDGSVASPLDATGGTATGVTLTVSTSSPLRGTRSAVLSKNPTNCQGMGGSYNLTIAKPDRWKTEKLYIEIEASSNFVAGDVTMHLLDTTNNVWIPASLAAVPKLDGMGFTVSFDLTNSLTYRFAFHIATTNGLAWDLKFDTLLLNGDKVLTGNKGPGPWTVYPGNVSGMSDNQGTIKSFYRTNGENIDVRFEFLKNATPGTGSATGTFSMPDGFTSVSNMVGSGVGNPIVGTAGIYGVESATAFDESQIVVVSNRLAIINKGGSGYYVGSDFRAASQVNIIASIPVNELVGSVDSAAAGTDILYAFNSSATATTDTTSFAQGKAGAPIYAFAPGGANAVTKRVRFSEPPVGVPELMLIESNGNFTSFTNRMGGGFGESTDGTLAWGWKIIQQNATDFDVLFYNKYTQANGANWNNFSGSKWVLQAANPTKPSGVYKANDKQAGFLSHESEGSFTGSFTGVTGTVTGTFTYVRTGKQVTLQLGANVVFTKDGSAGVVTISGLPSALIPSTESYGTPAGIAYNGAAASGNTRITTAGTIQLYRSSAEDSWAASSTGVMVKGAITYRLP